MATAAPQGFSRQLLPERYGRSGRFAAASRARRADLPGSDISAGLHARSMAVGSLSHSVGQP